MRSTLQNVVTEFSKDLSMIVSALDGADSRRRNMLRLGVVAELDPVGCNRVSELKDNSSLEMLFKLRLSSRSRRGKQDGTIPKSLEAWGEGQSTS